MESTRRLSLTLLLVTPIITARRLSFEDLDPSGMPMTWGGHTEWDLAEDWSNPEDQRKTYDSANYYVPKDTGSWRRRKRALDSPGEDLETAEQVLFRPNFRYKHLVKEREEHHRQQELRRQFTQNSPVATSSSTSVITLLPAVPPAHTTHYYSTYPQNHNVLTSQVSPVHSVYSPQVSTAERVYSVNAHRIIPNYQQPAHASSQYPQAHPLQYSQNEVFRPQQSYAYLYSQRLI